MAGSKPKRLRIVTKCATADEFVGLFCLFYDGVALYVMTPSPSEPGQTRPLLLTLSDGTPLVRGQCEVLSAYSDTTSPYGKAGMRVRLTVIDEGSEVIERLARAAEEAEKADTVKMPSLAVQETPNELRPALHAALTQRLARLATPDAAGEWSPPLDASQPRRGERMSALADALHSLGNAEPDAAGGGLDPLLDELFYCELLEEDVELLEVRKVAPPDEPPPEAAPPRRTERVRAARPPGASSPWRVVVIAALVAAVVGVVVGYAMWGGAGSP